jgi:hypothetical protein
MEAYNGRKEGWQGHSSTKYSVGKDILVQNMQLIRIIVQNMQVVRTFHQQKKLKNSPKKLLTTD